MDPNKYPAVHPQVASRTVDGSAIVVLADSGEVKILNAVGTRVWELVDGERTVQQIIDLIIDEFEVPNDQAQQDVVEFLQQLDKAHAIQWV